MANNHKAFKEAADMLIECRDVINQHGAHGQLNAKLDHQIQACLKQAALKPYELAAHSLRKGDPILVFGRNRLYEAYMPALPCDIDDAYRLRRYGQTEFLKFATIQMVKDYLDAYDKKVTSFKQNS